MAWTAWNSYQPPPGWAATRRRIMARDQGICHVCGQPGANQVDHLTSVANGGTHNDNNLAPIHHTPCHTRKTRQEQPRPNGQPKPPPRPTTKRPPPPHPGLI